MESGDQGKARPDGLGLSTIAFISRAVLTDFSGRLPFSGKSPNHFPITCKELFHHTYVTVALPCYVGAKESGPAACELFEKKERQPFLHRFLQEDRPLTHDPAPHRTRRASSDSAQTGDGDEKAQNPFERHFPERVLAGGDYPSLCSKTTFENLTLMLLEATSRWRKREQSATLAARACW